MRQYNNLAQKYDGTSEVAKLLLDAFGMDEVYTRLGSKAWQIDDALNRGGWRPEPS